MSKNSSSCAGLTVHARQICHSKQLWVCNMGKMRLLSWLILKGERYEPCLHIRTHKICCIFRSEWFQARFPKVIFSMAEAPLRTNSCSTLLRGASFLSEQRELNKKISFEEMMEASRLQWRTYSMIWTYHMHILCHVHPWGCKRPTEAPPAHFGRSWNAWASTGFIL